MIEKLEDSVNTLQQDGTPAKEVKAHTQVPVAEGTIPEST